MLYITFVASHSDLVHYMYVVKTYSVLWNTNKGPVMWTKLPRRRKA